MANQPKAGLDYFPMDVGFLRDKKVKLLKAEFGVKSVVVVLLMLSKIYEEYGYFLPWDKDECLLMSEGVGDGCSPQYISEVLNGCLSRSFFDEGVFQMFGVLTSRSIQRRYLNAKSKNVGVIYIDKRYWLLDIDNKKDVSASTRDKLVFFDDNRTVTSQNRTVNPENRTESQQRKEKKRKENIYCAEQSTAPSEKARPNLNQEAEVLFEHLWKQYPQKKGKGQVSLAAKKRLLGHGNEQMERAIARYLTELKKDADWRKPQNGSTFFNSGYIDYLDSNYSSEGSGDVVARKSHIEIIDGEEVTVFDKGV